MKGRTLDLLFPIIGTVIIIKTFIDGSTSTNLFGIEISIWLYRFIWMMMIVVGLYRYFNPKPGQN